MCADVCGCGVCLCVCVSLCVCVCVGTELHTTVRTGLQDVCLMRSAARIPQVEAYV